MLNISMDISNPLLNKSTTWIFPPTRKIFFACTTAIKLDSWASRCLRKTYSQINFLPDDQVLNTHQNKLKFFCQFWLLEEGLHLWKNIYCTKILEPTIEGQINQQEQVIRQMTAGHFFLVSFIYPKMWGFFFTQIQRPER